MTGIEKEKFLAETKYVDFSASIITQKAAQLFDEKNDDISKVRSAFEFVRDDVPHSFDIGAKVITAKASDVLFHRTGICHAKANLLAALLRYEGIPTGFCFQRLTRGEDDSQGYCIHCFNAVWLDGHWVWLDARGNTNGRNAQFSTAEPILAFRNRPEYDEYFFSGIYAEPQKATMVVLERAASLDDVLESLPDMLTGEPDWNMKI